MQVQACKDKASTLVKVVTLRTIREARTLKNFDASITEMNSTDGLFTSIVDKRGRSVCFNHRDELDNAVRVLLHACQMLYTSHACVLSVQA